MLHFNYCFKMRNAIIDNKITGFSTKHQYFCAKYVFVRKLCLLVYFMISSAVAFSQYTSVSYYVVAHPDDWQLFMGVNAFNDITPGIAGSGTKVVLIYTTAGEDNCYGTGVDAGYYTA